MPKTPQVSVHLHLSRNIFQWVPGWLRENPCVSIIWVRRRKQNSIKNTQRNGRIFIWKKKGHLPNFDSATSDHEIQVVKFDVSYSICQPQTFTGWAIGWVTLLPTKIPGLQKCSSLQDVRDKGTPFINKKHPLDTIFRAFLSLNIQAAKLQTSTTLPESNAWVESLSKVNLHQSWCRVSSQTVHCSLENW